MGRGRDWIGMLGCRFDGHLHGFGPSVCGEIGDGPGRGGGKGRPPHRVEVTVLEVGADLAPFSFTTFDIFSGPCSSSTDTFCRNESLPTPSYQRLLPSDVLCLPTSLIHIGDVFYTNTQRYYTCGSPTYHSVVSLYSTSSVVLRCTSVNIESTHDEKLTWR